jgi:beta-glucosidase
MDYKNLSKIKYWGASTAAHQVEGGNHNQWSVWELESASELAANSEEKFAHWLPVWEDVKNQAQRPENYVSGLACDHYNLYEKDFSLLEELNMNAFRCSIEWSRVEPEEGKWDYQEIEQKASSRWLLCGTGRCLFGLRRWGILKKARTPNTLYDL